MHDDEREYHAAGAYVHIGDRAFTLDEIWNGVEAAEDAGIPLSQISHPLSYNWSVTVGAAFSQREHKRIERACGRSIFRNKFIFCIVFVLG